MNGITLIYSPDDNGWYLERHSDGKTSQVFPTERDAHVVLAAVNGPNPPLAPLIDWD